MTKLLMTLSALLLAALGLAITFLPQELLVHVGVPPEGPIVLLMKVVGALYLGAAVLNWMSRGSLVGGIYGRPVTMNNFFHFAIGAVTLLKGLRAARYVSEVAIIATIYTGFAIWFGLVLFTHPSDSSLK